MHNLMVMDTGSILGGKMEQYYCLEQIYGKSRWIHQYSVLKKGEYYTVHCTILHVTTGAI